MARMHIGQHVVYHPKCRLLILLYQILGTPAYLLSTPLRWRLLFCKKIFVNRIIRSQLPCPPHSSRQCLETTTCVYFINAMATFLYDVKAFLACPMHSKS